jgi:hypothetical protein
MAYGRPTYQRQAAALLSSIRRHSPGLAVTLATDRPGGRLSARADHVVGLTGSYTDCRPKLDLDVLSPYRQTLYLDADSLVVRDLAELFDRFGTEEFVVLGRDAGTGHWYGDVAEMCRMAGSSSLPRFNGGLILFTRSALAVDVFAEARAMADRYEELGFDHFRQGVADEPLLAIALARRGISALDPSKSCASLLGLDRPPAIDVLSGVARFSKRGTVMAPAVVHFAGDYSSRWALSGALYRRETLTLRLVDRGVPARTARMAAGLLHGLPCWLLNQYVRRAGHSPWERPG